MEDWEIAPGCIRETVGTKQEKIAFSKPALCTGNGVKACEDLYFRVQTLSPGQTQLLEVSADTIGLISVAEGKVRVKLSNEPAFLIGTHGMIKIRPGVGGSIRNIAGSGDVVLHITTLML
ncbi:hypothetical protein QBC37DRAFT_287535 [Rhypophila decipiens]|uniref:Uncharacterized protein n=1 Tax=Rhypophila decipiens TaxID=261697 RepID=A0AAN6Y5Q6_9PEZI|nr:hypothetical protein QBC37DRAFT_287535 [Rhypophila decipiens]